MRTRLPRLLHRLRGPVLAYVAYAAVLAAAGGGLWVVGEREYQARLERLHHQLDDVTSSIANLVGSSLNHVDLLRSQAEALLAEPAASDQTHRLFQALAPSDSFGGYALDRLPSGRKRGQAVNLTGAGEIPPMESGAGREILAALALSPLFEAAHRQLPDASWIYYTSKNHFIAAYPWVPSRDFHWAEELLSYEFYRKGLPAPNPAKSMFWTDLYVDAAGKGLMSTVGAPVYDGGGRFRGTIALDLTLSTMSRFLARGEFGQGRALLVNRQNHVIADNAGQASAPQTLLDLAALLPDAPGLRQALLSPSNTFHQYRRESRWLFHVTAVEGAPWRVILMLDRGSVVFEVLQSLWIGFAGLALLGVAVVAVELRRRSGVALAENVAALQRVTLTLASARDEAQQANRAKSMLLANVSHELRTPLNAIIGFSDVMQHQIYGPLGHARYAEYAGDIRRSGELLLSLINDLLDVTKLEAGRHELMESDCDLAALAEEAAGLVKVQAERAGVALETTIAADLPLVFADERALRQVVLNLLSNAVKFTPGGGSVHLACALDAGGNPTITVKDTGRGIPHEEMQNLFKPFARTAAAKRAGTPGTGLGLTIVKSLVELHQGRIALESRVGFGTTVTITLPAERVVATAARGAA